MIRHYAPHALYSIFLSALLYTYASLLGGCGASAIGVHAAAADATRTINDAAVVTIETLCRAKALDAAANSAVTTNQAELDAAAVLLSCTVTADAQRVVAEAHTVWVSFLLKSIAADEFNFQASLRLAVDFARLYGEVVQLTLALGGELPALPPIFTDLLGATNE